MGDNESVDKICAQIEEDGEREIESILEKARGTAADIVAKAEARRDEIAGKILKEARERGASESRRLLSSVNIEVRRARLKAREEVVSEIMKGVEGELGKIRESGDYEDILASLLAEGIRGRDGKSFVVHADRRDIPLIEEKVFPRVKRIMKDESRPVGSMQARPLEKRSAGGVRVGVPGGRVIYDNTFEARMFRYRDAIRTRIFDEVFAEEDAGEETGGS